MRRIVRSEGYARARLVTGAIFMLLGVVVIVRTVGTAGLQWGAAPAYVLGVAMILLGAFRFYEYRTARRDS
jgi:uncharacterized membrane protein HdeD (DUF308 family)